MAKIRKNIRGVGQNIPDTFHDVLRWIDAAGNNESRNAALFVEQSGF